MNEEYFINRIDKEFTTDKNQPTNGVYFEEKDYQELQRNLILYKQGNREATTYIVKMFHPFITKYTKFIKYGCLPYSKYTTRNGNELYRVSPTISKFVSLFIEKKDNITKDEKKKLFSLTCVKVKNLFNKYDYSDIYNELVLALLNMANKYKITKEGEMYHKKNGTFHMYVSKCFHWEAYRFLTKLINDPLSHIEVLSLRDQFDDMDKDNNSKEVFVEDPSSMFSFEQIIDNTSRENDIKKSKSLTLKEEKSISAYDLKSLNFNWISGVTCSELFKCLSIYEREIITLSFIDKKTDIEIGKIYNCHRATINEHKKKAVIKIKQMAEKLNIILQ